MNHVKLLEQAQFESRLWWIKLEKIYGSIGETPYILLNNRLRTTAARAWIYDGKVDLCTRLLVRYPQEYFRQTIPHELAHMVAWRVFGYEGAHGIPWKNVMIALGLEPRIYHSMLEWEINDKAYEE